LQAICFGVNSIKDVSLTEMRQIAFLYTDGVAQHWVYFAGNGINAIRKR
jgi:hypothetical protein